MLMYLPTNSKKVINLDRLPVTVGLHLRDVDVLTVQEDGLGGTTDTILLDRAMELGRLIFSQE